MFLGFEDVATKWFDSVSAHVHWVYCVYLLLNAGPFDTHVRAIAEKQNRISRVADYFLKGFCIVGILQIL